MPTLGDLLAAARQSAGRFAAWLDAADPLLAERVDRAATAEGLGLGGFARMAVADFARFASEEDWATLISSIRDAEDPGRVCLVAMVHWRLSASACSRHSHQAHVQAAAEAGR